MLNMKMIFTIQQGRQEMLEMLVSLGLKRRTQLHINTK